MSKISVYDKVVIENLKKRKYGNRKFHISLNLNDGL